MVRIVRYEVYADKGAGWSLVDQFAGDDRQNAVYCAQEIEENGNPVKIIREIYETDDNSFQETVEYVSGLKFKTKNKVNSIEDELSDNIEGEYNIEATPFKMLTEHQMSKAIMKLVLIIVLSLLLANILVGLSIPLVEFLVPDEKRKGILFFCFFVVFILIAAPLLFYKIPWNVFYSINQGEKELINEKRFFKHADILVDNYHLNDDGKEVIVPAFPEAPLEYKQYIIDYLSQILNNLDVKIKLNDSFNRLGIELVVYGGCLELSRYGHLLWAEANSLLYEAFKVLEGEEVDLSTFYEAKRSYGDNRVAIFLTGVGAYLMTQVINDIPMDANVLKSTMEKWISFNTQPETDTELNVEHENVDISTVFDCLVNIRLNIQIYDDEKEVSEGDYNAINAEIYNMIMEQVKKSEGGEVTRSDDVTTIKFKHLGKAVNFIYAFKSDIDEFKDKQTEYNLIIDNKFAIVDIITDENLNINSYITDILDYAYNQDIIINNAIKDELLESSYGFEFLGDKPLRKCEITVPLYKMSI